MIKCGDTVIEPTIFPDGTSQVWRDRVDLESPDVWWWFESEAEFMHLVQFIHLRREIFAPLRTIFIPFLPYARQHRDLDGAFALKPFIDLLEAVPGFTNIATLDSHHNGLPAWITNVSPEPFILQALQKSRADVILYPDEGAARRYGSFSMPTINCEKDRDPRTGHIRGLYTSIESASRLKDLDVLIVDDICDGGATFIGAAELAHAHGAASVSLYITHGIFSKGIRPLLQAGFRRIYTTNSVLNRYVHYGDVTKFDCEEVMKGA